MKNILWLIKILCLLLTLRVNYSIAQTPKAIFIINSNYYNSYTDPVFGTCIEELDSTLTLILKESILVQKISYREKEYQEKLKTQFRRFPEVEYVVLLQIHSQRGDVSKINFCPKVYTKDNLSEENFILPTGVFSRKPKLSQFKQYAILLAEHIKDLFNSKPKCPAFVIDSFEPETNKFSVPFAISLMDSLNYSSLLKPWYYISFISRDERDDKCNHFLVIDGEVEAKNVKAKLWKDAGVVYSAPKENFDPDICITLPHNIINNLRKKLIEHTVKPLSH